MIVQPNIIRFLFSSEQDAHSAQTQLAAHGLFGDFVSTGQATWKVVVAVSLEDMPLLRDTVKFFPKKPNASEVFDPNQPWENEFRPLA